MTDQPLSEQGIPLPSCDLFLPPQKYSVSLKGHSTSVSLEPLYMRHLHRIAQRRAIPVGSLISAIDALSTPIASINLSCKLRTYVLWDLLETPSS